MDCFAKVKNPQVNYLQRYKRKQKEQTIRKVMGGAGNFQAAWIFFVNISIVWFFYRPVQKYFLGLIGVSEFSLARIFFVLRPQNISNGPSLKIIPAQKIVT